MISHPFHSFLRPADSPVAFYPLRGCTQGADLTPNTLDALVNDTLVPPVSGPGNLPAGALQLTGQPGSVLTVPAPKADRWFYSFSLTLSVYPEGPGVLVAFGEDDGVKVHISDRRYSYHHFH